VIRDRLKAGIRKKSVGVALRARVGRESVHACRTPVLLLLACVSPLVLVGCDAGAGRQASTNVTASTTQHSPSATTSSSAASVFDPGGASTPSEAAVAFENAIDNYNANGVCNFISPAYLAAVVKEVKASSNESCVEIWTGVFKSDGPSPIPPSEEDPTAISVEQSGDTAQVVIDYNIPPNSGATLANSTDALVLQNGHWLVDPPSS